LWDSSLIGPNKTFHSYIKKAFTQNNNAGTLAIHYDGNLDSLKGIEETMYHSAYRAISIPSPKVLVIGVGGGTDILTALYSKASHVTGVEINGAIHKIIKKVYKDYFKNWVNHPKVDLVHDEGRHYLSKTDELYDIIQLTGVDSYSGTMASANIFSENYLYTREAVRLYYQKLTEQGIVSIITLEFPITPREALRMLTTVVAELRDMGVQEPYKHIAMITSTQETLTALLLKRTPFSETEIQKLKDWTAGNPNIYFSSTNDLKPGQNNIYQVFLKLNDKLLEKAFITVYPYNIMPTTDDQPFFFRYTKWMHLKIEGTIPVFEYNILILLFVLTFVSWILIYLPLKHLLRMNIHIKGIKRYIIIFSSIGLGYLFIEIAYMQKLGLFLGHPNLAISVVLSGLLLSTGIGSIYSKSIIQKFKNTKYVTYGLSLLILFEYIFILPYLNTLVGMNGLIKGAMAFLLLLPIGVILGIYMPTAIDQLKMVSPKYVPWGWGINGIFSVISPILAIAISVTFGINFLLLCSIPLYLVAGYFLYSE